MPAPIPLPVDPPKRAPKGLKATGRKLWKEVVDMYDLTDPEAVLLREACRTADSIDELQETVAAEGVMTSSPQGPRAHPALVELRQQRIALARLWAAMRLPIGEEAEAGRTPPARGPRGVYGGTLK